jgi:hypothetical protein
MSRGHHTSGIEELVQRLPLGFGSILTTFGHDGGCGSGLCIIKEAVTEIDDVFLPLRKGEWLVWSLTPVVLITGDLGLWGFGIHVQTCELGKLCRYFKRKVRPLFVYRVEEILVVISGRDRFALIARRADYANSIGQLLFNQSLSAAISALNIEITDCPRTKLCELQRKSFGS